LHSNGCRVLWHLLIDRQGGVATGGRGEKRKGKGKGKDKRQRAGQGEPNYAGHPARGGEPETTLIPVEVHSDEFTGPHSVLA
jgi:hypothetical protein